MMNKNVELLLNEIDSINLEGYDTIRANRDTISEILKLEGSSCKVVSTIGKYDIITDALTNYNGKVYLIKGLEDVNDHRIILEYSDLAKKEGATLYSDSKEVIFDAF